MPPQRNVSAAGATLNFHKIHPIGQIMLKIQLIGLIHTPISYQNSSLLTGIECQQVLRVHES